MKAFEQLERLTRINRLIKEEKTGTPEEFACCLHIGRRRLFEHLDELRTMGVKIGYSKQRGTYYFSNGYEIELSYSLKIISQESAKEIFGGSYGFFCRVLFLCTPRKYLSRVTLRVLKPCST